MKVTLRGVVAVVLIMLPSLVVYFTFTSWPLILLFLVKYGLGEKAAQPFYRLYNWIQSELEAEFFTLVAFALELAQGTQVSYTVVDGGGQGHLEASSACVVESGGRKHPLLRNILSAPSGPGKVRIIMLNHHCRVDWVYLFLFCARSPRMTRTMRIVLKEDLQKIPMMGGAMQQFRFLFLSRSWQSDEGYLKEMVDYYKRTNLSTTILIFPEGTDLSPSNVDKSQAFAQRNGLPVMRHVLNPRTTGLVALKNMFGAENVEEIVDCTMGYTYGVGAKRPSEPSLLDGSYPRKAHLLIRRYRTDSATAANTDDLVDIAPAKDDEALKQWINARFAEKEQLLSRFYSNNPVGFDTHDVRAVMGEQSGVLTRDETEERSRAGGRKSKLSCFFDEVGIAHALLMILYWILYPTYIIIHTNFLLLVGFIAATFYFHEKALKKMNGLQRPLLLHQVGDDETFLAKLKGRNKKRKQDH